MSRPLGEKPPQIVYLTRKFPPAIGGMEKQARELAENLPGPPKTIALQGKRRPLWWFLPWSFLRALQASPAEVILAGDALMSVVAFWAARLRRKAAAAVVHGLDVVYPPPFYRLLVLPHLRRMDLVIAVSGATKAACLERGVAAGKIAVIPNAITVPEPERLPSRAQARERLVALLQARGYAPPVAARFLVIVGRVIPRKGQVWFAGRVLPRLPEEVWLLVAGAGGGDFGLGAKTAASRRVVALGAVDDREREALMRGADLVLLPNLKVAGDLEGFGIVALEAAALEARVLAAAVDGLTDAILDGLNGRLVPSGDAAEWEEAIREELSCPAAEREELGEEAARFTGEHFSWFRVAHRYAEALARCVADYSHGRRWR